MIFRESFNNLFKKNKKKKFLHGVGITLLGISPVLGYAQGSVQSYDKQNIADVLGWVSAPEANLCQGYFAEPQALHDNPIPGPYNKSPVKITYAGPGEIYSHGLSVINKDVVVTQPGRIATADKATIYREAPSGKISYVQLEGNVEVHEFGKLVKGQYCKIDFNNHTFESGPAAYHIFEDPKEFHTLIHGYDAWGTADRSFREPSGILNFWKATYTTCSPTDPTWQISAGHLVLDKAEGVGTAYNSWLRFYRVPIFYVPIYSFPIDNRRKSGFLTPDIEYSSRNGTEFSLPYYWNLAPNYDLTTTPKYFQNRGFQLNSLFRYLYSPGNHGNVFFGFLPYDNEFASFRKQTLENPPNEGVPIDPYLDDLENDSPFRAFVHLDHSAQFNEYWSGHLNVNYVTDDYYFKDFGNSYGDVVANQLLNQADLEYNDEHWNLFTMLQGYQTLHRIDQAPNPALNQYMRLPEIDLSGDYADLWYGTDLNLNAQSVNFLYQSDFPPVTSQMPEGERLHLRPTLSHPFLSDGGYLKPQLALDSTNYAASLPSENNFGDEINNGERPNFNASRNIPIFDIDSGLYFDQHLDLGNQSYLSTLEPRLFYLYVPYVNQNKYPNFDSELLPFTFAQLFDVNRFTSYDRLENANQISVGLTSRLLNAGDSSQKLKFDFGFGYYFDPPRVCLDAEDCETSTFRYISPTAHLTPFITQATYYPWQNWSTTASFAWDSMLGVINNAQVGIGYNFNQNHIFNFTYQYVRENSGDPTDIFGMSNDTNLLSSGVAWPLTEHWSALAFGQLNISKERPDSYYGGVQYDACCWTMRFIASRSFDGNTANSDGNVVNSFKNAYYFQLELKSLGSLGASPGNLLSNTLSGFLDPFK